VNSFSLAQAGNGFEQLLRDWKGETFRERVMVLHETCTIAGRTSTFDQAAHEVVNDPPWAELVDAPLDQLLSSDMRRLKYEIRHRLLRQELKRCLSALAEVALRPLVAWLLEHRVSSCTLIPCGWLAAFPLLSAEIAPGQTMGDIFVSSMAPNARSLLREQVQGVSRSGVYSLGNPEPLQNPLRWGEAEALAVAAVARHLKLPREVQVQERATRRWLLKALQKGYIVSASCHGIFDLNVPLQSALLLARGERLTLGEVLNGEANLRGLRLLILSACQTALLDLEGAREEVRSLAAGMLQAGAKAVLASLWLVDDMATFLLMTRFAQEWLPNMDMQPPAAALTRAQRWLRQATHTELLRWQVRTLSLPTNEEQLETNAMLPVTEEKDTDKLLSISARVSEKSSERGMRYPIDEAEGHLHEQVRKVKPDACPFADPIYWAGFQIIGW
jgi:CHAT domain-containing protein